ncbi:MAG TPA: AAA family ATPase [Terriglobia bacterium]|nr:AAA family ATPase [Terriglobia bacterium]
MYEEFYGLSETPFSLTPDPKFFYHGASHIRAFELLRYGIHRGEGFIVVYGDIGAGKTTLCRAVLENLHENVYTALLLNPFLSEIELLRAILRDFGVISQDGSHKTHAASKDDLIASLNKFLISIMDLGGRGLVVIDEAQNIPIATLEQIRILSNLETNKRKLLQIVLVGQSELKDILERPELRQLAQRISLRCELAPLSLQETADYINHRIKMASAGPPRTAFTPGAVKVVYDYSNGTPRLINLIADRSLTAGLILETTIISARVAKEAVKDLELRRARRWAAPVRTAIVLVAVALFITLLWAGTGTLQHWLNLP